MREKLKQYTHRINYVFCVKVQNYGYMTVTLLSRENRVAYIKREFTVYNKKVRIYLSHGPERGL
jgi:hypothetical protein